MKSVFVFSFFINMLMLAVPLYLIQIYSKVIPNHSLDTLYFLTAIMIVALLALGYLSALRRRILAKLGARFENRLGTICWAARSSAPARDTARRSISCEI